MRNIFGDQGNMEWNFWEQRNSVKVNFGEHLCLFLKKKGTTVNFQREQGNMHPPGRPSLLANQNCASFIFAAAFLSATLFSAPPSNLPTKAEERSTFGSFGCCPDVLIWHQENKSTSQRDVSLLKKILVSWNELREIENISARDVDVLIRRQFSAPSA